MEQRRFISESMAHLDAAGFDLLSQVEAFLRYAKQIHEHVVKLKDATAESEERHALHEIRANASHLLRDCESFCATVRDVQTLTAAITPERRLRLVSVANDRRRRNG
jgi:hypothetical protein